jgi:hypothetical protein
VFEGIKKIEEIKKLIDADVEKGYEKFNEEFEKLTDGCDEFRNYEKFSELFEQLENIKNILKENSKGAKGRLDKEIETIKKILNSKEYKDVKSKIENCKKFFEECRKS